MTATSIARLARYSKNDADDIAQFIDGQAGRLAGGNFIADIFARHYGARLPGFMPELITLARDGYIQAAVGTRSARDPLFLERYLDEPIETAIERIAGRFVPRSAIAEVGQLAADRPGAGTALMLHLARHLSSVGYEWMALTATEELRGIFVRLGLPLFTIARAAPSRLGEEAEAWGRYYDHHPLVVCASVSDAMRRLSRMNGGTA